ncbi:hypothetical protein IVB30_03650 [Bradyrhizobium sp. 200]|nr:hypothetical protein [Bradyrhizobium sp. 200]UPJ50515.1 hypothetical protein IVB30_03650 [Bradyrhizobium sp. 200]
MNKFVVIALATIALSSPAMAEQGNTARGERDFRRARLAIRSNLTGT